MSSGSGGRLWLRPVLMVLVGLAFAGLLLLAEQWVAAALMALFALFMGFWTSPWRSGPHLPLAQAAARRADDVAIVLWAPGDPLSSRLHTAIRGPREDVIWVNVDQDADARAMLAQVGGREKLPLAIVGEQVRTAVTVGDLLDMRAAGKERAAAQRSAGGDSATAGPTSS